MSPVAASLDGLLALLLMFALGLGVKLNTRLKALREGQAGFAAAVIELNQAAARAEAGLEALKAASESAHDDLLTRIETARGLVGRLERAGADAHRVLNTLPESSPAPGRASASFGSGGGGSLAAIAALAEGRPTDRGSPSSEPWPASPQAPRRTARAAFDEELFETKSRDPVPRERAPRERASREQSLREQVLREQVLRDPAAGASGERLDLGSLRTNRGDR